MKAKYNIYFLILLLLSLALVSCVHTYPAKIQEYKAINFNEKASHGFFYSIGNSLKYSDSIDANKEDIWQGTIENSFVSPDNKKILIVSNSNLLLISSSGDSTKYINKVKSFHDKQVIGSQFIRDDMIQWARDSNSFYLIQDEFHDNLYIEQLFSKKAVLHQYDVKNETFNEIIKPFPSHNYFFGENNRIYFSIPIETGELVLKGYIDGKIYDVKVLDNNHFEYNEVKIVNEIPFYTFSTKEWNYIDGILKKSGVYITSEGETKNVAVLNILSDDSAYNILKLTKGVQFKGLYSGINLLDSVFLPGKRFFFVNIDSNDFKGQLLIDKTTQQYKELPKDTKIHLNINTMDYMDFQINNTGIKQ